MTMHSRIASLLLIPAALMLAECGGRALVAPPSAGTGIRVVLNEVELESETATIELMVFNDLDQDIVINRNQLAVVAPDGIDYFRTGGRDTFVVKPHGRRGIGFEVQGARGTFRKAPGLYVRFDGIYVGSVRADVPPMAIGAPVTGPGNARDFAAPAIPGQANNRKPGGSVLDRVLDRKPRESTATASAPAPSGLQSYNGPRRQLKQPGVKCAAIPLKATDVAQEVAFIMDEVLLTELQQAGFEAIGPEDINAMVGFEKVKDAVGCDDASCIAELGNALGVDYLVAGNLAKLESSMVLTMKIIDVRGTKVLARVNKIASGGQGTLPRLLGEAVQELVGRSNL